MNDSLARLPKEPADWLARPFTRFLRIEALAGVVLLVSTLLALVLSNTAWSAQFLAFWEVSAGFRLGGIEFSRSLRHWINDGLMTLFFFVIALELKRELALGELRSPRMAALPVADPHPGAGAAARSRGAVADGCADAIVLRPGGGHRGRAASRRELHLRAAQPRRGREPGDLPALCSLGPSIFCHC